MSKTFCWKALPVMLVGLAVAAEPMYAQGVPTEGPVPTTALIMVQSKSGAPLDPSHLKLQVDHASVPITSVRPVPPAGSAGSDPDRRRAAVHVQQPAE